MKVARPFLLRPGNEASTGSMFAHLSCVGQCNCYKNSRAQYCLFIMQDDVSSDESCRSEGTSSDSENEYDRLR